MKYVNWFRRAGRELPTEDVVEEVDENQKNFVMRYNNFLSREGFNIGQVECVAVYEYDSRYFNTDIWKYSLVDGTGTVIHYFGDYRDKPIPTYAMTKEIYQWVRNNTPHKHTQKNRMGIRKRSLNWTNR